MECQLVVKDFKKIKAAKVTVKGFTVLSAANAHGKSTLFDAVVKTLDNDFSDEYYRHGTDAYVIGIKVMEDDGSSQSVVVKREQGTNFLSFNNSEFRSKLGRAGLNQILPEFNLKRIDYESVKIYPNFALQGKIPMFEDISPTELLSSLYSDVFRISKKTAEAKKSIAIRKEEVQKVNSQIIYVQEQATSVKSEYAKLDSSKILQDYQELQDYLDLCSSISDLESQLTNLNLTPEEITKYSKYESLVNSAIQFKPQYEQYKRLKPIADKLNSSKNSLVDLQKECGNYSFVNSDLLSLIQEGTLLQSKQSRLKELNDDLIKFKSIDHSLVELFQKSHQLTLSRNRLTTVSVELESIDSQITQIKESLKGTACPTLLELGFCPYNK